MIFISYKQMVSFPKSGRIIVYSMWLASYMVCSYVCIYVLAFTYIAINQLSLLYMHAFQRIADKPVIIIHTYVDM